MKVQELREILNSMPDNYDIFIRYFTFWCKKYEGADITGFDIDPKNNSIIIEAKEENVSFDD